MKNYVEGKEYFIKGKVRSGESAGRPIEFVYESGYGTNCGILADEPGLLLTAEEVASCHNRDIANLERAVEELREENEALRKKIEKHEMTIEERTIECNRWEGMYNKASKKCDELQKTCEEDTTVAIDLARQRDGLKENYESALKTLAKKDEDYEKLKRQWDEALTDKDDLQKAVEALNKDIDGYRATIQKMAAVIGFLCGGEQDGKV